MKANQIMPQRNVLDNPINCEIIELVNKGLSYGQVKIKLQLKSNNVVAGVINRARKYPGVITRPKAEYMNRSPYREKPLKETRPKAYISRKAKPIPLKPIPSQENNNGGFTLVEISKHGCRWPISGEYEYTRFCGAKGFPYCEYHKAKSIRAKKEGMGKRPSNNKRQRNSFREGSYY